MDKSAALLFHNAKYRLQQRWRFSSLFAEGFQAYIFNHAEQPPEVIGYQLTGAGYL